MSARSLAVAQAIGGLIWIWAVVTIGASPTGQVDREIVVGLVGAILAGLALGVRVRASLGRLGWLGVVLAVGGPLLAVMPWPLPIVGLWGIVGGTAIVAAEALARRRDPRLGWAALLVGALAISLSFVGVGALPVAAFGAGHILLGALDALRAGSGRNAAAAVLAVALAVTTVGLAVSYDLVRLPGRVGQLPPRTAALPPLAVVIDTDMQPDDWGAILYLASEPQVTIEAVTVAGTAAMGCEAGVDLARRLLIAAAEPDVPVACGRTSPLGGGHFFPSAFGEASRALGEGLGLPQPPPDDVVAGRTAVELLADTIEAATGELVVLSLGPPTNVAEILLADPAPAGLTRIVQMGGAVDVPGNVPPRLAAEWNIYVDPAATAVLVGSSTPVVLVPLDATNRVPLTLTAIDRIEAAASTPVARLVARILGGQRGFAQSGEAYLWDQLAAVIARDERLALYRETPIAMIVEGPESGRTSAGGSGPLVRVAVDADAPGFERTFLDALNDRMP